MVKKLMIEKADVIGHHSDGDDNSSDAKDKGDCGEGCAENTMDGTWQ